MQEFTCKGRWWLVRGDNIRETDQSVLGRLTFSREHGLILETRLNLEGGTDLLSHHSLILGVVTEGGLDQGAITLQKCQRNFDPAFGQNVRQYWVEVAYFGQHFATQEQISFRHFVVKVDHLAAWVDAQGLAAEIERDVHGSITSYILKDSYGLASKVAAVGSSQIKINDGLNTSSKMTGNTRQFSYEHKSSLEVSTAAPMTVQAVLSRFVYPIADLATIATSQPQSVDNITAYYEGDQLNSHELFEAEPTAQEKAQRETAGRQDEQAEVGKVEGSNAADEKSARRKPRLIRIAYKVPDYSKVAVPLNRSVLFTLRQPQIQANFEQMLGRWLTSDQNVKRGLELVYGPVLRLYYAPQTSSLLRFFSLVQAAEGYHRLRYTNADLAIKSNYKPSDLLSQTRASGDIWPTDQHKAFRNELIAASESYGGWLASALHEKMSNEPNLITRLNHLLITIAEVGEDKRLQGVTRASTRVIDEATSALIFNRDEFSQVVAHTRNDFAHLFEAGEQREAATEAEAVELEQKAFNKRAAEGEELEYINDVLQYLIRSYMLYELGFDVQQRSEMIAQDPYYSTTMRRSAAIKDWIKNKRGEFRQRTKKAKKGPDESKEQATQKDSPRSREHIAAHFGLPPTATGEVYGHLKKLVEQGVLAGNDHARADELAHEFIQSNSKLKKLLGTAAHGDGGGRELS